MKIKTADLTGAALDWAVAKAKGRTPVKRVEPGVWNMAANGHLFRTLWAPSTDWAHGGPIIEREMLGVFPSESASGKWCCRPRERDYPRFPIMYADNPLIAAMRCFVASKLGDEVDVPDELTI